VERHPDSETLLAFREHRLAGSAVVDIAHHVGECAQCATVEPSAGKTLLDALRRMEAGHSSQRWLIAAAVAFTVIALAAIVLFVRRSVTPVIASKGVPRALGPSGPRVEVPEEPRNRGNEKHVVASLADGGGRIALLEDGSISGVELRSPRDAEDVRTVLSGGSIAIPTFIAAMPGAVRGGGAHAHPLRAIEPFRSAVRDPRFSWTPVRGARSYRVAVFDADYEEVARSEALTGTSWRPSKPLPIGVDLSWHVVAETDAGEISSAGSDRAEAVFRVLSSKDASEIDYYETQYRDSHLLRGLLYSRWGLLHDAEREFRRVAEQNPDSPVARALIKSVSR
jgi:hypothetical protein